jgi:hypothetical protein
MQFISLLQEELSKAAKASTTEFIALTEVVNDIQRVPH